MGELKVSLYIALTLFLKSTTSSFFLTLQPLPREYHFGNNFGYVVSFKSFDQKDWKRVTVPHADASRYVHKDETMPPSSKYQVRVGAFNNRGEGPFSLTAIIFSAQDGE